MAEKSNIAGLGIGGGLAGLVFAVVLGGIAIYLLQDKMIKLMAFALSFIILIRWLRK